MTIYEWADRLGMDPHKSRGPEDFWAICPCHSDTKPSLHVYIGGNTGEIVMKCFVCDATGADVCKALGLPIGEVMCDAMSGEKTKEDRPRQAKPKRTPSAKKPNLSRPFEVGKPLIVGKREYQTTNVYEYQDRDGRVVLRKARAELWENGSRVDKSFLIQSIGTDGKWYSGGGIYTNLIYHQPDVLAMKGKPGRTILAEGEKDVDNLRLLGINATCGMHGGGIDKGGDSLLGKWNDDHSQCFDGLDEVVVIADNDAAGEGIAQWICKRLKDRVKTLKLLRIVEHWPELPKHGDFTDWANTLISAGKKRSEIRVALESMIEETPEWEPGNIRHFEPEEKKKSKAVREDDNGGDGPKEEKEDEYESYFGSYTYCIKGGCLAQRTGKDGAARTLCSFLPVPKETIRRDDGSTVRTDYVIGATRPDGEPLEDARITGEAEFAAMRWPMKFWQFYGNIKPVKNGPQLVLDAISTAGQRLAKHRNVYEHTGMREIGGKMAYLYNGGAIGVDGVSVELTGQLQHYEMRDRDHSREDAAMAERMLIDGMPGWLILPELAQAYLAPLYSVLEKMQQPPSYVVYVIGERGAGKSTVTGYVQGHFGSFYERQFPSNFTDTPNQVRDKLFWAKDSLMVIDDYRKTGEGGRMRSSMDMVADAAITAVADRADRGRLDADKRMSAPRPCRSTCIMTGEDMPNVSISRKMRLYRITVSMGDIYKESADELDIYRQLNRDGYFRSCMRYYIEDLLERWNTIEDELERRIQEAAQLVKGAMTRREGRYLECATLLMCGIGLMMDHLIACGVMDETDKQHRLEQAARDIAANIDEQGSEVDENQPEAIWLQTLRSLLATRTVSIGNKDDMGDGFRAGLIGYYDGELVCLDPTSCDEYIGERLRKSGITLGASRQAILRALARAGMIVYKQKENGNGIGETTKVCRMGRVRQRMIVIYRWALEGRDKPTPEEQGFTPIDGEQLPMEFGKK